MPNPRVKTELGRKLRPDRFSGMSGKMTALVAFLLGEKGWTNPEISEMAVTSDRFVMAGHKGDVGMNEFYGSEKDVVFNLNRLMDAAGLNPGERIELMGLYHSKVQGNTITGRMMRGDPTDISL